MIELFVALLLIALNGVFALSELAIVSARRTRLKTMVEDGVRGASTALALSENPGRFLSTVQIGITSISIMNGIVGEAVLAAPFAVWLHGLGLEEELSQIAATALVVVLLFFVVVEVVVEVVELFIVEFVVFEIVFEIVFDHDDLGVRPSLSSFVCLAAPLA